MTIGLIFECGPRGADQLACEYFAAEIRPGVLCKSVTLDNKPNLLANAASAARELLADGCKCVLIIWDLHPAWPDMAEKPCRADERQTLLTALAHENLQAAPVYLVCAEQEFESWLLADEKMLSAFLSTAAHEYKVPRIRRPDREKNPKSLVMNHFQMARGMKYVDRVHAIKILKAAGIDLKRLRRSESFARFEAKLLACA